MSKTAQVNKEREKNRYQSKFRKSNTHKIALRYKKLVISTSDSEKGTLFLDLNGKYFTQYLKTKPTNARRPNISALK